MKALSHTILLLATLQQAIAAPPVGRLFLTPEERRQIDLHPDRTDAQGNTVGQRNKNDEDHITINGMVTRNNGKQTIWINRVPVQEGQNSPVAKPLGIPRPATVEISLPGQNTTHWLKAGQSYDQISGSITEGFIKKDPPPTSPPPSTVAPNSASETINPNDFLPGVTALIPKMTNGKKLIVPIK